MRGTFNIECEHQPDGSTAIGKQQVQAPWHLSKPYWDGEVLLIQNVNMTAGIFSGDALDLQVRVKPNASVLLTSPSAQRIHTMRNGEAAMKQTITVEDRAWLEWMPELFIPQRDSRYTQQTELFVKGNGMLFAVETFSPGRVAHGEVFEFDRVKWSNRIWLDDRLILTENFALSRRDNSLFDLMNDEMPRYFASATLVHPNPPPIRTLQENIQSLNRGGSRIGASQIDDNVIVFRVLTLSSPDMKHALAALRSQLANDIPGLRRSARKL